MRQEHVLVRTALGMAAVAALASGCVADAGQSIVIVQNQVPGDGCLVSSSIGDVYRPVGSLDVALGHGYIFTPVVQSRAVTRQGDDPTRRMITVEGAEVTLEGMVRDAEFTFQDAPQSFTVRTSGSVPPGGTLGMGFDILLSSHAAEIERRLSPGDDLFILAEVVVFGKLAGSSVDSEPFVYPLNVCAGCLADALDLCELVAGACRPLQDAGLICTDPEPDDDV